MSREASRGSSNRAIGRVNEQRATNIRSLLATTEYVVPQCHLHVSPGALSNVDPEVVEISRKYR